jgi:hypothetical protein
MPSKRRVPTQSAVLINGEEALLQVRVGGSAGVMPSPAPIMPRAPDDTWGRSLSSGSGVAPLFTQQVD